MDSFHLKRKGLCRLCIISFLLLTASGCAAKYTIKTESINGKVVDAETNEPIEDVIVIGYWPGYTFYLSRSTAPTIEVLETISDRDGNYFIPGWLKKDSVGSFRYGDPEMIYYKNGYEIVYESNAFSMENFKKMPGYFRPWQAEWNGKAIKLKKFKGDNRAYREYLNEEHYNSQFREIFKYCKFLNVPKMLVELEEYYQTQPDYRPPGWTVTVGNMMTHNSFRTNGITQPGAMGSGHTNDDEGEQDNRPLADFLTITQINDLGRRCEITPIEYLNRIMNNEKDFIRSTDESVTTGK